MDSVGAILVSILIAWSAITTLRRAWQGIVDRRLDESIENQIREEAKADPEVRGVVSLRTRAIGSHLAVDLKLAVSPNLTLREGYQIADRVKAALLQKIDKAKVISVRATGEPVS
jgi:divalent metal cation (Fe/Co/Zn/Cd) transporter